MRRLAAVALALGLAACDGEDPVTSVTREVSAANHAAAAVARAEAEEKAQVEAAAAPGGACAVEVSFGSFGQGVDTALRAQILDLTGKDPAVVSANETRWGREGETTLCLRFKDEAAANRAYGAIAAMLPSTSTRAPTTVRHQDGRSRAVAYPTAGE